MRNLAAIARALYERWRPARRGETEHQWLARRYPHLTTPAPWTDGTD